MVEALRGVLGPDHVLTDPDVMARYETDWTGEFHGRACAVVRPESAVQVSGCVAICRDWATPLVAQGGNTGLVGGSVPDGSGRSVVLSTARLDHLGPVEWATAQVTLGAGVTLAAAQRHVGSGGLAIAVDLAARDSATIGGMVATNAGGVHVLRHGMMRRQVVGIEAVLGTGELITHLGGLEKDNTGYDLAGLLCGSEGTLGIITAARLRLVPVPAHRTTALLAWEGLAAMVDGLVGLRRVMPEIEAAEYFVRPGLELVMGRHRLSDPFDRPYPAYLLVEAAGTDDPTAALAAAVGTLEGVRDVAVATNGAGRGRLWALRELHTEALTAAGPPRKYDVSVPAGSIATFVRDAATLCSRAAGSGAVAHHFGHLGDGNIHLNLLGVTHLGPAALEKLDGDVLTLVAGHGGSISAEHGIGRLKQPWLPLSRSDAERRTFSAIKAGLDPAGILNPGVLLPANP